MACIDIPSMSSTDLNQLFKIIGAVTPVRCQETVAWPDGGHGASKVTENDSDYDHSPEPCTPRFGDDSTPTFSESKIQFGFAFLRPGRPSHAQLEASDSRVNQRLPGSCENSKEELSIFKNITHVSGESRSNSELEQTTVAIPNLSMIPAILPGATHRAEKPTSFITFLNEPIAVPPDLMDQYKPSEGPGVIAHTSLDGRLIVVGDAAPPMEQDSSIKETDARTYAEGAACLASPYSAIPQSRQQSTGEVADDTASKPASYIRFLNEPIVIPHELIAGCIQSEGASTGATTSLDGLYIMQTIGQEVDCNDANPDDVLQNDPAILTQTALGVQIMSSEEEVSTRNIARGLVPFLRTINDDIQTESNDFQMDVAAYQSVDDASLSSSCAPYTESNMEPASPRYEESGSQDATNILPFSEHVGAASSDYLADEIDEVMTSCDNIMKEMEEKLQTIGHTKAHILKQKLNRKIQKKRLREGKGELKVNFDNRPFGEPTEDDIEKTNIRKQKNRDSAVKSRERRQVLLQELEQDVRQLERGNKRLKVEIEELKTEKELDLTLLTGSCDCFNSESDSKYEQEDGPTSKSWPQALSEFFSLKENT